MPEKENISTRESRLSPTKRALFEKRLKGKLRDDSESHSIPRRPDQHKIPMSFAQERLWFLSQLEPNSSIYNCHQMIHLSGLIKVDDLEQSLAEILKRHEVLRASFSHDKGRPFQVIGPTYKLNLPVSDLRQLSSDERERRAMGIAADEAQRPFDLAEGPLLRGTLLRLRENDHLLLLVIHHIAFDGWSAEVLLEELASLYGAFAKDTASALPELSIQYADFAYWQKQRLRDEVFGSQLAYWLNQLKSFPSSLELPTDHPRPAVQSYRGASQSLLLHSRLTERLKALASQTRATLFMTLLAAFQLLLHRYTGQDDIIVGSHIAGRGFTEIEKSIGCFVNTLALRTDFCGNPSFKDVLYRVRETTLDAYDHQDIPFEKLVKELKPEQDPSRPPLFQVLFQLRNFPKKSVNLPGLKMENLRFESGMTRFDLELDISEDENGLLCLLTYNADLFEAATIMRMAQHMKILLESVVGNPEAPVSQLPILAESERSRLLVQWNDVQVDYPEDLCIQELFEAQVEQTPDAIALVFGNQQLTYRELNSRANQLAKYLREQGVGPETLVAIFVERSFDMVVGLLGILKSGGAYLPLDRAYPKERLALMIEKSEASILLTKKVLLKHLPAHKAQVICLDSQREYISQKGVGNITSGISAESLAYVIFTSGSTGVPKGVLISHRAVVNQTFAAIKYSGLQAADRRLQAAAISFDVAAAELFSSLSCGACVVLWPDQVLSSPTEFVEFIEQERLTVVSLPTSYWHEWVSNLSNTKAKIPSSLRLVIVGTEQALQERFEIWHKLIGNRVRWLNAYGPTEATITSTIYEPSLNSPSQGFGSVPIGRPIANTQIYLLDSHLQPVPIGVHAELHIGGAGLARGYHNRPDLTAEKFIPNPFSNELGGRIYKTGDLARYLPDGNIEFLGRLDRQVKIRGYRVELGEVEAALAHHPAVRETAVLAFEDESGNNRLAAYVALNQENTPIKIQLRNFLKEKLPDYMLPSVFEIMEEMPLTQSGKVDRKALPFPDYTRPELEETFVAPRTPIEITLAAVWSELLRVERIGIHDNFFELGGHSLLATQVVSRVNSYFQVQLPLRNFYERPTVDGLIDLISEIHDGRENVEEFAQTLMKVALLSEDEVKLKLAWEKR